MDKPERLAIWFGLEPPTVEDANAIAMRYQCMVCGMDEGVQLANAYANHTKSLFDIDSEMHRLYMKYGTSMVVGDNELLKQFLAEREKMYSHSLYENLYAYF
jgi:hypothetical protein